MSQKKPQIAPLFRYIMLYLLDRDRSTDRLDEDRSIISIRDEPEESGRCVDSMTERDLCWGSSITDLDLYG